MKTFRRLFSFCAKETQCECISLLSCEKRSVNLESYLWRPRFSQKTNKRHHPDHLLYSGFCSFFGRVVDTISCFQVLLTFRVVYMCSSLLQLAPGSHDLSQVERKINVAKAQQILKMTIFDHLE